MKKLFCILLSLLLLTSCGAPIEENPYLTNIREQVQSSGKLFGVAYLGNAQGDFKEVQAYAQSQEYIKLYPFIGEIKESHFAQNEGNELYCLVPADSEVTVSVYQAQMNEDASQLTRGEEILSYTDGRPILIRGNISDIMPNLMIVATRGDAAVEYAPCISLMNGLLENSEQKIYDFSPYELMAHFNGLNPEVEWNFFGNWTCTALEPQIGNIEMNLSISADGIWFDYTTETLTGNYTGDWLILSDQRLRMELGGSTFDAENPGALGYHTDVDGIYHWDVKDGNLYLTYLNGTRLYPVGTVAEFVFTPVN